MLKASSRMSNFYENDTVDKNLNIKAELQVQDPRKYQLKTWKM